MSTKLVYIAKQSRDEAYAEVSTHCYARCLREYFVAGQTSTVVLYLTDCWIDDIKARWEVTRAKEGEE